MGLLGWKWFSTFVNVKKNIAPTRSLWNEKAGHFIDGVPERTLSAVTLMELLQGARSVQESREIRRFFQLQVADSLIAATARESGETLATGNVKHFRRIGNRDLKAFRRLTRLN
jgi:predicted nucleic acid-binding protein